MSAVTIMIVGVCALTAGCGAAHATNGTSQRSPRARCGSIDLMTPNWQDPEAAKWQVASLAAARRVTHLPLLVPRGVGSQATIYALPTYALLVYHGDPSGDMIITESRPQLSEADWQQSLKVVPAQDGKPYVTGSARVVRVGRNVKALQTKSPCLTGSTAEWRTVGGRLQIIIDAHTLSEDATARIARQTEQRIGS